MILFGSTTGVNYIKPHVKYEVKIGTNKLDMTNGARDLSRHHQIHFAIKTPFYDSK